MRLGFWTMVWFRLCAVCNAINLICRYGLEGAEREAQRQKNEALAALARARTEYWQKTGKIWKGGLGR